MIPLRSRPPLNNSMESTLQARDFFHSEYLAMQTHPHNLQAIEIAGFRVLSSLTLPRQSWVTGYYEILGPRARALLDHPAAEARQFAEATLQEIAVFERYSDSYGYVFYALQRP
ncbi:MAG: hypothetical protein PHS96_05235 [Anaerolineales bacterium]|nr:hypothetical protein [Anaerolineales bacterium]